MQPILANLFRAIEKLREKTPFSKERTKEYPSYLLYLPPFLPHLGLVPPSIGERSLITHLLKDLNFAQKYFTHTVKRKKSLEAREKALPCAVMETPHQTPKNDTNPIE